MLQLVVEDGIAELQCFLTVLHYGSLETLGKGFTRHTRYREATQKREDTAVSDVQDDDNLGGILPSHMDGKKIKLAV